MSKLQLTILLIVMIIATAFICISSPKLHKKFVITGSDVKIVDTPVKTEQAPPLQPAEVPVVKQVQTKSTQVVNAPQAVQKPKTQVSNVQNVKTTSNKTSVVPKTQVTTKKTVQTTKTTTTPVKTTTSQQKTKTTQTKKTQSVSQPKTATKPAQKTTTKTATQTKTSTQPKTTAKKVEIDWEKWRNNINSRIVANSTAQIKKSVPAGTKYEYSFNVNNKRQISNIRVAILSSDQSKPVTDGVNIIILAIMNLEGNSILNYPAGAEGITTRKVAAYITIKGQ